MAPAHLPTSARFCPRKIGTNWFMPALVKRRFGESGMRLEDGTMVVVESARDRIGETVPILVTSVLQTTAGKMIFGRYDERVHAVHEKAHNDKPERPQREQATPAAAPPPEIRLNGAAVEAKQPRIKLS